MKSGLYNLVEHELFVQYFKRKAGALDIFAQLFTYFLNHLVTLIIVASMLQRLLTTELDFGIKNIYPGCVPETSKQADQQKADSDV